MVIQSQTQPTLVLMAGLSGTGKTTLALALGYELRWPVIHKDHFKYILLREGMDNEMAGHLAYEHLFTIAYDLLFRQNLSVILASAALHRFIVVRAIELTHLANARLKVIFCSADQDIRKQRIQERPFLIPSTSPLIFDPTIAEDDPRRFAHLPTDTLILSTTRPMEEYLGTAVSYAIN